MPPTRPKDIRWRKCTKPLTRGSSHGKFVEGKVDSKRWHHVFNKINKINNGGSSSRPMGGAVAEQRPFELKKTKDGHSEGGHHCRLNKLLNME